METTTTKSETTAESVTTGEPARAPVFTWHDFWPDLAARVTSRKLWMLLLACTLPWVGLERGVNHLYALQPWQAGVYGSMFLAVMGVIGALVAKFMGIDSTVGTSTSVVGAITAAATNAFSREEKVEHIEHVIREGSPGAPARRPFNPDDSHDNEA